MAVDVDSKQVPAGGGLLDGVLRLGEFFDSCPRQQFLQLSAPQFVVGDSRIQRRLGAVEQLVGRQVPAMDIARACILGAAESEIVARALDCGTGRFDLFAARASDQFVEARLGLPERSLCLSKTRSRTRRVLAHQHLAGDNRLTLGNE